MPRFGIVLLGGFLASKLLTPLVLQWLDVPALAAHVVGLAGPVSNDMLLWAVYGVVVLLGGAVGWCLSPLINRLLGGFFRGV